MITPQSIFNAAWQRFIVEGRLPCIKEKRCAYSHDGNNCAVGAAMTEDQIQKITEEGIADYMVDDIMDAHPDWFIGEKEAIINLQYHLHDKLVHMDSGSWNRDKEAREDQYRRVAKTYGLEIPK